MYNPKFRIGDTIKFSNLNITLVEDEHNAGNGVHLAEGLGSDGCKYNVLWSSIEDGKRRIDWDNPESVLISENE